MSFDWSQYIEMSKKLNGAKATEGDMRCAISRAYYGAFNLCRIKSNFKTRTSDVHYQLIQYFKDGGDKIHKSIGHYLDTLREARNKADYDGFYTVSQGQVHLFITYAEKAVALLKEID